MIWDQSKTAHFSWRDFVPGCWFWLNNDKFKMCETRWSVTTDSSGFTGGLIESGIASHSASLIGDCGAKEGVGSLIGTETSSAGLWWCGAGETKAVCLYLCVLAFGLICALKFMCGIPVSMMQVNSELPVTSDVWTYPIMLVVVSTVPKKFSFPGFEKIQDEWWSSCLLPDKCHSQIYFLFGWKDPSCDGVWLYQAFISQDNSETWLSLSLHQSSVFSKSCPCPCCMITFEWDWASALLLSLILFYWN